MVCDTKTIVEVLIVGIVKKMLNLVVEKIGEILDPLQPLIRIELKCAVNSFQCADMAEIKSSHWRKDLF